jgi:hypothetical protein
METWTMVASKLKGNRPNNVGPKIMVVRVESTSPTTFVILSKFAWGVPFHWYGNRSHRCTKETHESCENCVKMWPDKWRAYLHCDRISGATVEECIVEITNNALVNLETQTAGKENFRGCIIQLSKTAGGKKGRFIVQVLERSVPEQEMRAECDP